MSRIDPLRHLKVFNPNDFGTRRIDVIGAGATGSRIALALAKLGVQNLHVHDFDKIAEHNIANQAYSLHDIGKPKVEALAELIEDQTGLVITKHAEAVGPGTVLGDVVFMLTDTMKSRQEIFDGAIEYKPTVQVMIETRMGADSGRVYTVPSTDMDIIAAWRGTLCKDDEAVDSACGARISVGPTAEIVSGYAVWQFMRWWAWSSKGADAPEFEMIFAVRPAFLVGRAMNTVALAVK